MESVPAPDKQTTG